MKKFFTNLKNYISAHRPTKRRIIQLYSALLFNANLKGFKTGKIYRGSLKNICAPGINCYSCPGASLACPLGSLQDSLIGSNTRLPYYVFGIIILYGFLFGRWICSFLCPFGLIQDLIYKIKTPKVKKNRVTRVLAKLRYVILALFVFALPLIYMTREMIIPAFCKYICPAGVVEGSVGLLSHPENENLFSSLGPLFTWKVCLGVAILVLCVFIYRFFCRFLCPLGAIYGLFNRISLVGVKLDEKSCTECGLCEAKCKIDIKRVGDGNCIFCGECIDVCPTGAISWKGPKILLPPQATGEKLDAVELTNSENESPSPVKKKGKNAVRIICATLMAALLAATLVYYNVIDKIPATSGGNRVGESCLAYDIELYGDGGVFNIEQQMGKVTVINFWYTTCGGCLPEIPHFNRVAEEYEKYGVSVIGIHSSYKTEDVQTFLDNRYDENGVCWSDYTMKFGQDDGSFPASTYADMLEITGYPTTFVVNKYGEIVARFDNAVSYETLKDAVEQALKG